MTCDTEQDHTTTGLWTRDDFAAMEALDDHQTPQMRHPWDGGLPDFTGLFFGLMLLAEEAEATNAKAMFDQQAEGWK